MYKFYSVCAEKNYILKVKVKFLNGKFENIKSIDRVTGVEFSDKIDKKISSAH